MNLTATTILVVKFSTGWSYTHGVGSDREAQMTVEGWQRQQGLWVIDPETRTRSWCPWHTVTEVALPNVPHAGVVGGRGPAVVKSAARPTISQPDR